MSWLINEIVRSGNSTARVKSYDSTTNFIVLFDIYGTIEDGSVIIGDESGTSGILNNFIVSEIYNDDQYANKEWDDLDYFIYDDTGELVALDQHFTGKLSQDYQTTYMVRINGS